MRLYYGLVLLLFLLSIFAILGYNQQFSTQEVELEKYINTILTYLHQKYPDADIIDVVSVQDLNNTNKKITFRITFNYTSPCPKRYHAYFIYPEYLTKEVQLDLITWNCELCKKGPCKIIFKEEAIIAAYNKVPSLKQKHPQDILVNFKNNTWNVTFIYPEKNISVYLSVNGTLLNQ